VITRQEALRLLTMTCDQAAAHSQVPEWEQLQAARRRARAKAHATAQGWYPRLDAILAELHATDQPA
jgi:hypothetical protein